MVYSCWTQSRGVCGFNENCRQTNKIFIALLLNYIWKICPAECTNDNSAMGQTNEKQLDRTSNLRSRQKIVYFKCDVKDEQNHFIRDATANWKKWGITSGIVPPLNRWTKIVDKATDAFKQIYFDLIKSCFVFDFVKRLVLPFIVNPKLFRSAQEERGF